MTIALASLTRRTRDPEPSDTSTPIEANMAMTSVHLMFVGCGLREHQTQRVAVFGAHIEMIPSHGISVDGYVHWRDPDYPTSSTRQGG